LKSKVQGSLGRPSCQQPSLPCKDTGFVDFNSTLLSCFWA